jgi:4-amino-4-deoxy-L-arabinose transferase-like glycosyltransferase
MEQRLEPFSDEADFGSLPDDGWRQWAPFVAALALALLAWWMQATWLLSDHGPPESDEWHQLTKSEIYFQAWRTGGFDGLLDALGSVRTAVPPLVHVVAIPFFLANGGFSMQAAALSLGPWIVLLVLCTYDIGQRTLGPLPGLAAAALCAAMPLVVSLSHSFQLDLPLAALVAATLAALVRSESLSRPAWSLLAALLLGLALLVKTTAGVYLFGAFFWIGLRQAWALVQRQRSMGAAGVMIVAGPTIWMGWWLLANVEWYVHSLDTSRPLLLFGIPPGGDPVLVGRLLFVPALAAFLFFAIGLPFGEMAWRGLAAAAGACFLAAFVSGAWYLRHAPDVVASVAAYTVTGGGHTGAPAPHSLRGWLFYPWAEGRLLPRAWFELLLVGLPVAILKGDLRKRLSPVLGALVFAFVVLNLTPDKEARFVVPLSCALAVLAAATLVVLPRLLRLLVAGTVVAQATGLLVSWWLVRAGSWEPPLGVVWPDDRVDAANLVLPTGQVYGADVRPVDLLDTPDFFAVARLPREMPFSEKELPLGYPGP